MQMLLFLFRPAHPRRMLVNRVSVSGHCLIAIASFDAGIITLQALVELDVKWDGIPNFDRWSNTG
jgi:hypothetical protein